MIKRIFLAGFFLLTTFLFGCREDEKIIRGRARGNRAVNVETVQEISELGTVKTVSVVNEGQAVLAGLRLQNRKKGQETCDNSLQILKRHFPDAEVYIVAADEEWAEDVIELTLYAEGGMDRDVLEKRFEYLMEKKLGNQRN